MSQELQIVQTKGLLAPVASAKDILEYSGHVSKLIKEALVIDVDYGAIGNTANKTLLKPGAEKLATAFGLVPHYSVYEKEVDHDRKNKTKYGTSEGLYRFVVLCELKDKSGKTHGTSFGSCSTMESKYISRPHDCENTTLKMAQKRAFVGATVSCFNLSGAFTQDMEDIEDNAKISKQRETKKTVTAVVYDKQNEEQQLWLIKKLDEAKCKLDFDDVGNALHGRPITDARQVVEELKKVAIPF